MPRTNIYLPEDLAQVVKDNPHLNLSGLVQDALRTRITNKDGLQVPIDPGNNIGRYCDVIGVPTTARRAWKVTDYLRNDPKGGSLYRLYNNIDGKHLVCSIQSMTNLY